MMLMVGSAYADLSQLNTEEHNLTTELQKTEITALKEKIKKLEDELATFKKVKPIASKAFISAATRTAVVPAEKAFKGKKFVVGTSEPKKLTAYYTSNPQTVERVKYKLEINGFDILAVDEIFKNKTVISFTNETLQNTNSFLSVLHMLVSEDVEIRVQNPSYFGAAFLQDQFKYGQFMETLQALESTLGEMYEVEDKLGLSALLNYHFMLGMPRFNDMIVVAKGEDIVERVSETNTTKYISYLLKLPNGSTLVGHKLDQKTYDYLKKIKAEKNAQIFPYEVMIKDKKAVMLSPKYYLALSLPLLSMTDFLKIASAPDEIEKDIRIVYEKELDPSSEK
jgi:hypothetical protein